MTSRLTELCVDAHDPLQLARFWAGVLGRQLSDAPGDGVALQADDEPGFPIRFLPSDQPKTGPNQVHFDLTSTSLADQQAIVARALELGGRHLDIGQLPEEGHVVLADPEGNEFCVIEPGNSFLAGTATIGALSSDGSQAVGYFWSRAMDWPLVWDQDEETAIQSPRGGSKISWGGPPVAEKHGKNRVHFNLRATDGDSASELARLGSLGASTAGTGQCGEGWTAMTDPDGNEFCLRAETSRLPG
ncbi:VOC family protein [Pedococcus aerophilus]|uniref:VOC family protein n=1 Tax=Pedococcus aerophilus TaxID=436356 RepID=A0ABN3UQB8_9MICO